MNNQQRAAMQMALEALEGGLWDYGPGQDEHDKCNEVITALREALAQPDHIANAGKVIEQGHSEQEPVAWRVHPFDYGVGHEGAYAMTMRLEQVEAWNRKGWIVEPLYAAPVSAEAIRSEALEEAAKVCRTAQAKGLQSIREAIEAAIRGLK